MATKSKARKSAKKGTARKNHRKLTRKLLPSVRPLEMLSTGHTG